MTNKTVFLIFPHHLFEDTTALEEVSEVYIIEEYLFLINIRFINKNCFFIGLP